MAEDVASQHYLRLVDTVRLAWGDWSGKEYGWKSGAARLLGVSPSYISKIDALSDGDRFQVGPQAIAAAAHRLPGLPDRMFSEELTDDEWRAVHLVVEGALSREKGGVDAASAQLQAQMRMHQMARNTAQRRALRKEGGAVRPELDDGDRAAWLALLDECEAVQAMVAASDFDSAEASAAALVETAEKIAALRAFSALRDAERDGPPLRAVIDFTNRLQELARIVLDVP